MGDVAPPDNGEPVKSSGEWIGTNDGEPWTVEVEPDCMAQSEPFTVSIWVGARLMRTDPKAPVEGAFVSAEQARDIAATLLAAAGAVDRANAR